MTTPRSGEREPVNTATDTLPSAPITLGGAPSSPPPAAPTPIRRTRLGTMLASPLGIVVSVPGLVALVGVFLTLLGDQALRGSNLEMARERLSEETRLVAASLRYALGQSEPVLDRVAVSVRGHDPSKPFDAFAHSLADLMHGRPGIAYVSASFPDGTFQGAYLDDDRVIRFQDSRIDANGTRVRRYHLRGRDTLELQREERSDYDPRARSFYRLAVDKAAPGPRRIRSIRRTTPASRAPSPSTSARGFTRWSPSTSTSTRCRAT